MFRRRLCEWRMRSIRTVGCLCMVGAIVAGEAKETPAEKAPSAWDRTLSARLAGGFKDNVTLSEARPEASPFLRSSLDVVAVRLPVDGIQIMLLLMGEDTRYFSSRTVDHEDFVFGQAELRRFWLNDWQAAFSLESAYIDQVIDLSVTETVQTRLPVRGGTVVGRPSVRRELSANWWISGETPFTRQMFDGLPDDYSVLAPKLSLGRTYGHGSEIAAAYEYAHRVYDTDVSRRADRSAITNENRISLQHEVQLAWKQHWDAKRRLRTQTRASYRVSGDRHGRYFDYDRTQLSEQVRFRAGRWEASVEARVAWYRFPHQPGTAPGTDRERTDVSVTVRAERGLGRWMRVFAEYEHAQTTSSLELEEYAANTVFGGVGVEF